MSLQRLRTKRLAAREGEKLAHQSGRPVRVLLDLHDVLKGRIGRPVIGEQEIGIADDRGQDVVEVMRDAAGELADRLHLLALREVLLQSALFGGVEREHGSACAFVAPRIGGGDEEAGRARRARALERNVERRDVPLALSGRLDRCSQRGMVTLGDQAKDRRASRAGMGFERVRSEPGKGGVGTQQRAGGVESGDRDRGRIEDPREADFGRPQILAPDLGRRAIDDHRARGAGRAIAGKGDPMQDAHRQQPALARLQVDVEGLRRDVARLARHHGQHRAAVSGQDVVDLEPAYAELGQIVIEPARQSRVHVRDRAVGFGREEAGRRMVEIVDGVLKVLEECLVSGRVRASRPISSTASCRAWRRRRAGERECDTTPPLLPRSAKARVATLHLRVSAILPPAKADRRIPKRQENR